MGSPGPRRRRSRSGTRAPGWWRRFVPGRRSARCLAGAEERLADCSSRDGEPFGLVGGEPRLVPSAGEGESPCECVCVLDAGVPAESAVGRHDVGGVADEESSTGAKPRCDVSAGSPGGDVVDDRLQIRNAGCDADRVADVLVEVVRVGVGHMGAELPAPAGGVAAGETRRPIGRTGPLCVGLGELVRVCVKSALTAAPGATRRSSRCSGRSGTGCVHRRRR